jgi:hypothetical protein
MGGSFCLKDREAFEGSALGQFLLAHRRDDTEVLREIAAKIEAQNRLLSNMERRQRQSVAMLAVILGLEMLDRSADAFHSELDIQHMARMYRSKF